MNISRKMSIYILAVLVIVSSAALYSHYRLMILTQKEDLELLGRTVGRVIEESLVYNMITRDTDLLNKTLHNLQRVEPISRILLLNNESRIMAGTDDAMAGKSLDFIDEGRTEEKPVQQKGLGKATYRWVQDVRNRSECHSCHSPAAKYNGSILIDFSTAKAEQSIKLHVFKESLIFLAAFSVVGLSTFLFSNIIVIGRLNRVIDSMRRFKNGDETTRMAVEGKDEISVLCAGFNDMADAVVDSQRELKKYARELLALAVSSHVVTAAPRTENLYEAICHIAVRELKINLAWIGLFNKDTLEVEPAACCSSGQSARMLGQVPCPDPGPGIGPSLSAIRKKVPQVVNNIASEPVYGSWREDALKRGYRSAMALPLLSSSADLLGVLNFYSDTPGFFTRKRVRMFMVFSNQVSTEIENRTLMENVERSKAELSRQFEFISRSQKEWQTTFDSITDMVTIHDREFRIIKANRAVSEYFGLPPKDVINRKCFEIFHDNRAVPSNCPHAISLHGRQAATAEVKDPKTGKLFRVSTFPYYSFQGEFAGSVHVARDITREKETEMRLIMSERLAALGQMASGLAHEINTPLASIAGCAEGLLMKVKNNRYDPQIFEEYLQIVEEEIQRCKCITTGMLSFVRTSSYEQKNVQINEALDKTLEIISFQGRLQNVTIKRHYQDDLPAVHGSEGELRQVFLAIIINALDAMEDSGMLNLETGGDGETVWIRMSDTGPGIEQENLTKIFDPFFTTKSAKGGTGLGLSIAYKIITNHNGAVDATSEEGKGTTFVITLPLPANGKENVRAPVNVLEVL